MKKNKTYKNGLIILLTFVMLLSAIGLPITANSHSVDLSNTDLTPKSSQIISRSIRVAIYDDTNITLPSYTGVGTLTNDHSNIETVLLAAGFEVSPLTTNQIYNHELKSARYDVFIMADHLPKSNITNFVEEYWLGGGALLSMDSAVSFLCYAGILPPESAGDDGFGTYWSYQTSTNQDITTRHPVSRSYAVDDVFTISGSTASATFDWTTLLATSIASELVKIATRTGLPNDATVVAYNPQSGGGKVVHILSHRELEDDAILVDAIEWLYPRPKGRILFDLSHYPYYGIDSWDDVAASTNHGIWRNTLVSRGYTIDKLYPSATGNLTSSNLLPYDMLFLCLPEYNFSSNEVTAVTQWVNDGGGLIAIGEWSGFADHNSNINYLYGSYDLQMVSNTGTNGATYKVEHPTIERCTEITVLSPGSIAYSGDGFPIWGFDNVEIYVAGQEYGNGRILLMSDVAPFRDSSINSLDNLQYAINVANWLTSSDAKVLLYVTEPFSSNYYVTPVALALNDLGISFYLTFNDVYLNLSLYKYTWDLIIVDMPYNFMDFNYFIDYIDGGGRMIMSTYQVNQFPTHPLWAKLGFAHAAEFPDTFPIYLWDSSHAIFTTPVNYGADNFTPTADFGDEGDLLTVYPNATALAGITPTTTSDNATIVLRNDGKTLFNAYLIDQLAGDLDDSTYEDRFELWLNEIAFMLAQITVETVTEGGIPGYNMHFVLFTIIFSIGVISVIKIRKIRKN